MYYATKRNNTKTRVIGVAALSLRNRRRGLSRSRTALASIENKAPVESEVVIIEELEEVEDEPPPPPPVDVDLPPPPPQVILPDFVFDTPPPQENAIQQVVTTPSPTPPPPPAASRLRRRRRPSAAPKPNVRPPLRRSLIIRPPRAARARKAKSRVSVCVDIDGRMSNVKLVKSSGFDALDEAAVKGITKNAPRPGDRHGRQADRDVRSALTSSPRSWNLKKD